MHCTAHQALGVLTASFGGGDGGVGEEEEPKQLKRLFDCFLVVKKVSWLRGEKRRREKGGKVVGEGAGGLLTMGTTLLAPALCIWKPGFLASHGSWVARSPLSPRGGRFLDALPPSTPK